MASVALCEMFVTQFFPFRFDGLFLIFSAGWRKQFLSSEPTPISARNCAKFSVNAVPDNIVTTSPGESLPNLQESDTVIITAEERNTGILYRHLLNKLRGSSQSRPVSQRADSTFFIVA